MKIKNLILFLLFPFFSFCFRGQDTLVFTNLKKPAKIFKLPLCKYPVKVKTQDGKKVKAIITGYSDTSLTMNVWAFKKRDKDTRKKILEIRTNKKLTTAQADSMQNLIEYPLVKNVNVRDVSSIVIDNTYRKELKKKFKRLEIVTVATIVVFIVLPLATGLALSALYSCVLLLLFAEVVFTFFAKRKWINLKRNWKMNGS
jgi:hypothetical protein